MLTMNPDRERFEGTFGSYANMHVSRNYREPFVVPDQV